MYKMVVEITKEIWAKCGIKIFIYHNEEERINELWHKMNDIEIQLGHSNTAYVVLKRIRKYCSKKTKDITEKEKQKHKAYFKGKEGVFVIEEPARDIIEHCKLPQAIEVRKKLGYNHDDIMVREETSIAEKIIKLFPKENIVLNKKFNDRKPNVWFKNHNLTIELMKEIMKIITQTMKKKENTCLKSIILKFLDVIPMILNLVSLNL